MLMFCIDMPIPVRFKSATYTVSEGTRSIVITLEALEYHSFSFNVHVSSRDGTATGECHRQYSVWTNIFMIAHRYMYNIASYALLQ